MTPSIQRLADKHQQQLQLQHYLLQVLANFGGSSFKCDISSLESDALQCIQDQVQQTQVSLDVKVISLF